MAPHDFWPYVLGQNLQIEGKPFVFPVQSRPGQGRDDVIYLLISIMHFPMSDDVKMKIRSDLAEKDILNDIHLTEIISGW